MARRLPWHARSLARSCVRTSSRLKVRTLDKPNPLKATYTVIHMFVVLLLASVPSFILNLPVGIVAR